jgi:RNA polymerase sigma factor (sigma-70 family)
VIDSLRRRVLLRDDAALTDGQLVERYLRQRDESAFAALVQRHGPMVWGVCRRTLAQDQDAEDAFQATFLVLVRKAASVRPRELVGSWLHGVAHRVALCVRRGRLRRGRHERQVAAMPEPTLADDAVRRELQVLLDAELARLPQKYRTAIVLCDLAGRTRKEVARQLGIPEGTLSGWLSRGRALLARRLTRSGLAVSAAALFEPATAAPVSVVATTVRLATGPAALVPARVSALVEGVLKTMLITKLKLATVMLAAIVLLGAAAGAGHWGIDGGAQAQQPAQTPKVAQKAKGAAAAQDGPIETRVFGLRHAKAVDMAKTLQDLLQGDAAPGLRIAADPGSNSVVARGRHEQFDEVEAIILRLEDAATRRAVVADEKRRAFEDKLRRDQAAAQDAERRRQLEDIRRVEDEKSPASAPVTVTAQQYKRAMKFSAGQTTSLEGLSLGVLGTCTVELAATKAQWDHTLDSNYVRIVYAEPRSLGFSTDDGDRVLKVSEILLPMTGEEPPQHIFVRTAEGYRQFENCHARVAMSMQSRLRELRQAAKAAP